VLQRALHTKIPPDGAAKESPAEAKPAELTGSAKLFADAEAEERLESPANPRAHLVETQGPIWTGDESQQDAVLRMIVDKYKPLRTGEGIKDDAAEKRIKNWLKNLDMAPKTATTSTASTLSVPATEDNPHAPKLPPHLFRPWHATYTGDNEVMESPKVKWGTFDQRAASADFSNLMELRLPPNADGTVRKAHRDFRRSTKLQGRLGSARESAIDYRLGIADGDLTHVGAEEEEMEGFSGNRQIRGESVLGAQRGAASGMRAWAGLVEDRIAVSAADAPLRCG
jgi:aarF domain-containing kinase